MRVVASLTTIPSRIDRIRPVLDSLWKQSVSIERIEINVPDACVRTGETYVIPEWFHTQEGLYVYRTEDWGAITKVAPTLLRQKDDPSVWVWSVDDDMEYPTNFLEQLWNAREPNTVVALSGGIVVKKLMRWELHIHYQIAGFVDMIEGWATVLYPPHVVGNDFEAQVRFTSQSLDCRKSDDIVLSNYLWSRCIPMKNVGGNPVDWRRISMSYSTEPDALSLQDDRHYVRYMRVIRWFQEHGMNQIPHTSVPAIPTLTTFIRRGHRG